MDTKEFKIGNYVNYYDGYSFRQGKVTSISNYDKVVIYNSCSCKPKSISGVTLTEEWFLKFGFKKREEYIKYGNGADWQPKYPKTIYNTHTIRIDDDFYFGVVNEEFIWIDKYNDNQKDNTVSIVFGDFYETRVDSSDFLYCKIPEYVHQLQNLYFALTGKELEIKEV